MRKMMKIFSTIMLLILPLVSLSQNYLVEEYYLDTTLVHEKLAVTVLDSGITIEKENGDMIRFRLEDTESDLLKVVNGNELQGFYGDIEGVESICFRSFTKPYELFILVVGQHAVGFAVYRGGQEGEQIL